MAVKKKTKKPVKVRRTHQINVHLTPAEMSTLQANVLESGMTQSEYVRDLFAQASEHDELRQLIREEVRSAMGAR